MARVPDPTPTNLTCPLCGGNRFTREEERTDTRFGFSTHVKVLMVCEQCSHILSFYGGSSFFDFE